MRSTRDRARRSAAPTSPTLICCKTMIGKGAPNRAGTAKAHGEALGADEVAADARGARLAARAVRGARRGLRAPGTPRPSGAQARSRVERARSPPTARRFPELAAEFERRMAGELPANFDAGRRRRVPSPRTRKAETVATRKASQIALEAFAPALPELLGGSRRPDRLEPHQHQEHAAAALRRAGDVQRRDGRSAATSTTACASSAWPRS